jgi:arabinogalactan oligomer/maltooligosaccharide transport system permease protein
MQQIINGAKISKRHKKIGAIGIVNRVIVYTFLGLVSVAVVYPLVYVVSAAFSPGSSIMEVNILPFSSGFTIRHFQNLFTNTPYFTWFMNTLQVAIATCVCTVVIASLGAYVFSRFRFFMKKSLMLSLLILQIFPSFVGMIAIYVILLRIGGLNQLWGLVLIYVAGNIPFNTWLVKSYMDSIPKSLDEAARIDGASHFRVYSQIILPIARPILVFLTVTSFTGPWMDFIFPNLVRLSGNNTTLAMGLFTFVDSRRNQFTTFAAGAILIAIPFIIFFVFTQKMLVTSLGTSAVKE